MAERAIIIGAGPAGLTAAYKLLTETDVKPVVLEASGEVGGISRTVSYHGNRMDIGGHRFFSKDAVVNALWAHLLPTQGAPSLDDKLLGREKPLAAGGPDPETTDRVMLVRERVSRIYFLQKFFAYPLSLRAETLRGLGLRNTVRAGVGYLASCLHKRPEGNLADFYRNRFGKPLYEMFFRDYTEKLWGVAPENLSADWGAQRVKGLSLRKALTDAVGRPFRRKDAAVETSLIERYFYPKKGPGQLWEALADEVRGRGGEIRLHAEVRGIRTGERRVEAVVLADGTEVTGDYFLSSMPVKDLVAGMGRDAVPADVYEIASALPYRDFITVGLLDLCAGTGRETRAFANFQQLVPVPGRGPAAHGLDWVGVLLQRGGPAVGDGGRGVHRIREGRTGTNRGHSGGGRSGRDARAGQEGVSGVLRRLRAVRGRAELPRRV